MTVSKEMGVTENNSAEASATVGANTAPTNVLSASGDAPVGTVAHPTGWPLVVCALAWLAWLAFLVAMLRDTMGG